MSSLFFLMITLLFPLGSIANTTQIGHKKLVPLESHNKSGRRPSNEKNLIEIKLVMSPSSIIIGEKPQMIMPPEPKDPTYFSLSKIPSKKELAISFVSKDPHIKLSVKAPLVIQFFTDYPLQLSQSIISGSAWPKNGTPLAISYSGAKPSIQNKVQGKAAYTYCREDNTQCKAVLQNILFYFVP